MDNESYTVTELAKKAGVTPTRIRQLLLDGTIQGTKHGETYRGYWTITSEEANRWLDTRKQ